MGRRTCPVHSQITMVGYPSAFDIVLAAMTWRARELDGTGARIRGTGIGGAASRGIFRTAGCGDFSGRWSEVVRMMRMFVLGEDGFPIFERAFSAGYTSRAGYLRSAEKSSGTTLGTLYSNEPSLRSQTDWLL
jgi:hypothetical protein